ncbi:hypothetical protein Pan161_20380 [Gimesia algae]|uniref:Uncharacterized protein n=1 Tax=Gimesia algae TaxID=2527971 RepID=A0A517VBK9_9PLAN|nr:hypothetical protein Pan161_20380 [Gimesia algae]
MLLTQDIFNTPDFLPLEQVDLSAYLTSFSQ